MRRRPMFELIEANDLDEYQLRKRKKRIYLWNYPVAAWVIAGVTLVISTSLMCWVVLPLLLGVTTPFKLMVGTSYFVEDIFKDLVLDCPRLINSRMQNDIKIVARGVNPLHYRPDSNVTIFLDREDIFAMKFFLSGDFLSGISLTPQQLKNSAQSQDHFKGWTDKRSRSIEELFVKDPDGLEILDPCQAGDFVHLVNSRSVFRKIFAETTKALGEEYSNVLSSPGPVIGGLLLSSGASMLPTLSSFCTARLLIQVAGDALVYFRVARQQDQLSGVSLSPWLGVHLNSGDAMSWFPGMLFYIEPRTSWSLAIIITDAQSHRHGIQVANHREISRDALDDAELIKEYVQLMHTCHGQWPPNS